MKSKANRGFTLVELLVSVAVLSIVTLGIGGLLKLAAEQYSNATKETEVQNLIQSTFASMSNAIEDAAIDVVFESNKLTIVNEDGYIRFERDGSKLYYDEVTAYSSATDNDGKIQEARDHETSKDEAVNLLADHVKSFSVDTTTKDRGFIILNVTIEYHERSKNLVQNVFLRNLRSRETVEYTASTSTTTGDGDGGDGDGGDGDGGDGGGGADTPTTPSMDLLNPHVNNNELTFNIKMVEADGHKEDIGFKITRNDSNEYILEGISIPKAKQMFSAAHANGDQTIPAMPNFDSSATSITLNQEQLDWFKNYYNLDIKDQLPPVESGVWQSSVSGPYSWSNGAIFVQPKDYNPPAATYEVDLYIGEKPTKIEADYNVDIVGTYDESTKTIRVKFTNNTPSCQLKIYGVDANTEIYFIDPNS